MNYLFTICGRAGSKGLPSKNTKDFLGIPLVYYTLAAIYLTCEVLCSRGAEVSVLLNTDSSKLLSLVKAQNSVPFLHLERKPELSGDRVAKVLVIKDSLIYAQKQLKKKIDYVIDLDITSPLRTVDDIIKAVDEKSAHDTVDVVYSLAPARKNPYFNMAKEVNGCFEKVIKADYVSRQETPPVFDMNASIYVYEPESLMKKEPSSFFNSNAGAIIMKDTGILDIDSEDDLRMMEILAKHYFFVEYPEYSSIYEAARLLYSNDIKSKKAID